MGNLILLPCPLSSLTLNRGLLLLRCFKVNTVQLEFQNAKATYAKLVHCKSNTKQGIIDHGMIEVSIRKFLFLWELKKIPIENYYLIDMGD